MLVREAPEMANKKHQSTTYNLGSIKKMDSTPMWQSFGNSKCIRDGVIALKIQNAIIYIYNIICIHMYKTLSYQP